MTRQEEVFLLENFITSRLRKIQSTEKIILWKYIACKQKILYGKTFPFYVLLSNGVKMSRKINIALVTTFPSRVAVSVRGKHSTVLVTEKGKHAGYENKLPRMNHQSQPSFRWFQFSKCELLFHFIYCSFLVHEDFTGKSLCTTMNHPLCALGAIVAADRIKPLLGLKMRRRFNALLSDFSRVHKRFKEIW